MVYGMSYIVEAGTGYQVRTVVGTGLVPAARSPGSKVQQGAAPLMDPCATHAQHVRWHCSVERIHPISALCLPPTLSFSLALSLFLSRTRAPSLARLLSLSLSLFRLSSQRPLSVFPPRVSPHPTIPQRARPGNPEPRAALGHPKYSCAALCCVVPWLYTSIRGDSARPHRGPLTTCLDYLGFQPVFDVTLVPLLYAL